ncbi:F5/8 type C domain containing protein [Histomonas meleagridis]|uniref:F5/8 type C domain containing protein n=1 Tax=Histomonas meleagridis TaxID=135588 RepID=UPI00355955A9|nr:F5/8 type C domain containing protein [Histomonas meleagridis]KAH0797790.1 F5/8 type C domain containing protein [Histomonas meleagridis]
MSNIIHIQDIEPDFGLSNLENEVKRFTVASYELEIPKLNFQNQFYYLNSAYLTFQQSSSATNFIVESRNNVKPYKTIYVNDDKSSLKKLIILGLPKNTNKWDLKQSLERFRVKNVKIILSESKEYSAAILEFDKVRHRDLAAIKIHPKFGTTIRLYPPPEIPEKTISLELETKHTTRTFGIVDITTEIVFIHNNQRYICNRANAEILCKNLIDDGFGCQIPPFQGDFSEIATFIDQGEIVINEANVIFCYKVGKFLDMESLRNACNIESFINMNNVIIMANQMKDIDDQAPMNNVLTNFIVRFFEQLWKDGRLGLLPISILMKVASAADMNSDEICALIPLITSDEDKTCFVQLAELQNLDIIQVRLLLNDKHVDLNAIKQNFIQAYRNHTHKLPYIVINFAGSPFKGIFNYLTEVYQANPQTNGYVSIEASSNQVGNLADIINYNSNTYFSSRDFPNQWIKFTFNFHQVSISGYSYKTHSINGNGHTRSWEVSGSNNGNDWIKIHEMTNSTALSDYGAIFTTTFPPTEFYKYIKITQTGSNTMGYNNFRIASFELFGRVLPNEKDL